MTRAVDLGAAFDLLKAVPMPAVAAAVVTPNGILREEYLGVASLDTNELLTANHAFDLASLTKVLVTLPEVLRLLERGRLSLQDPLSLHLPEAGWMVEPSVGTAKIAHLLAHTSGLPAWAPLYTHPTDRATLLARVLQTPLEAAPGERLLYSDLGFMLLGLLTERLTGRALDELAEERGFVTYRPSGPTVATERCPWRGRVLNGEVHDENAYALGGVSGHAGAFGTLRDVARAAQAWLTDLVSEPTRSLVARPWSHEANGCPRGLGWILGHPTCSGGDLASPQAFGHTGFTGTSVWIEPQRGYAVVLLTNRVHPTRHTGDDIIHLRRRFANAVHAALGRGV
ncbi:serine hydrolase domain-containing protein [Deinococcus yavapaiensis]|uniref:CubicO group peptidase (Beta-lactamase class C family) n=1 Tax=Deinococcus yavapaiensis KR-236 TaxID=694435 RepID=A0A318SNC9_9DEIO|nr:serine hydrolase [Deinococcus yavapaiensis]PYE54149.1 CubicO group peptidase (beta-lactamase class C family) [Deinococcus yavapaiensis KR-236]